VKALQAHALEMSNEIARSLELAMLLEVSAYPKPGNVHRTRNFHDTKYEHFLASAVACRTSFEEAARRGILIAKRRLNPEHAEVGNAIRDATLSTMHFQRGGNTSLGVVTLLVPLAVAAGMAFTTQGRSLRNLRIKLRRVIESTTTADAVAFYEAVASSRPGGLGRVPHLDLLDPSSRSEIFQHKIKLLEIFRLAREWDSICLEWTTNYSITFDLGYPFFKKELSKTDDLNEAAVDTYLRILSEKPDTLISRKAGLEKARWVSNRAQRILALGGAKTRQGRTQLEKLDEELGINGNLLNPGATADLTASVVAIALLSGYTP